MSDEATEASAEDAQQEQSQSTEEQALAAGWKPQDQWKGEGWIDADRFMELRNSGYKPPVERLREKREENNQLQQQIQQLQSTITSMQGNFDRLMDVERQKQAEKIATLEAEKWSAVQEGDVDEVQKIEKRIKAAGEVQAKADAQASTRSSTNGVHPDVAEWQKDNPWFEYDAELRESAIALYAVEAKANPNGNQSKILDKVAKRIKATFPDKFENKNREKPSAVAGSSTEGTADGTHYSKLPDSAKQAFKMLYDRGTYGGMKQAEAREKYAQNYYSA